MKGSEYIDQQGKAKDKWIDELLGQLKEARNIIKGFNVYLNHGNGTAIACFSKGHTELKEYLEKYSEEP